jgi:capsular exopolysaccharide synthesis family protein
VAQDVGRTVEGRGAREVGEQAMELRRNLDALRRGRLRLLVFVLLATGAAVGLSLVLPKSYTATARILYDASSDPLAGQGADVIQRQLATFGSLMTTPAVLGEAAGATGVPEAELQKDISVSAELQANLLDAKAVARTPTEAQKIANAVARTFLIQQRRQDLRRVEAARAKLQDALTRIANVPGARTQALALESRLSELSVTQASAGSELRLAEAAQLPTAPSSPRPVLNGVIAFFASLFVGVLFVLGRDQLVPRLAGGRDLTRITDRPVLVSIPFVRRRFGRQPKVLSATEHEAYQTLQASLRFQLPPEEQHIILVTSAREGEGKTTSTANLGRALSRAGHKTLLISADMRHPKLHESFGLEQGPGLAEVLTALERDGELPQQRTISALRGLLNAQAGSKGNLHVLVAGKKPADPARLLLSDAAGVLFAQLRAMDYAYILLDGTPLLGLADSQALAQRVDEVLVVSRLDRLSAEDVLEVRDLLDRLEVAPLGHIVIGGRRVASSYYYSSSPVESDPA